MSGAGPGVAVVSTSTLACGRKALTLICATTPLAARAAYDAFLKKWTPLCPPVARSLEEAGLELLTFYTFPKAMWKSLRTTNALENLNREFRIKGPSRAGKAEIQVDRARWPR